MFKKGSDKKKFELDGDEEQFNDELQGFRRNQDSEYQIVEETMGHQTQKRTVSCGMLVDGVAFQEEAGYTEMSSPPCRAEQKTPVSVS